MAKAKETLLNEKPAVSIAEAARLLGCSTSTVYEGIRRGDIPSLKIAEKRTIIPRKAFERMLEYGRAGLVPTYDVDMTEFARSLQKSTLLALRGAIDEQIRELA